MEFGLVMVIVLNLVSYKCSVGSSGASRLGFAYWAHGARVLGTVTQRLASAVQRFAQKLER